MAARVAPAARSQDEKHRGRQRRGSATPLSTGGSSNQTRQQTNRSEKGRRGSQSTPVSSGRASQSTRGRPVTVASSSGSDSVSQGSRSSVGDATKDLERNLNKRLGDLRLGKDRTNRNAAAVNDIQKIILQYLKNDDRSLKWKVCTSGSYYEKTKVSKRDDTKAKRDIIFIINIVLLANIRLILCLC